MRQSRSNSKAPPPPGPEEPQGPPPELEPTPPPDADTPPPTPGPEEPQESNRWAEAIIVTARRTLQRAYEPGDIIPHPTAAEQKLCGEGAAEPLLAFWPGFPQGDPRRVDGRLYPVLMRREAELWVRTGPLSLRRLDATDRRSAVLAVSRSSDRSELKLAAGSAGDRAVRTAAQARLEGRDPATQPVGLVLSGGRPRVLIANGSEENPEGLYERDLAPLVEACQDRSVLDRLERLDLHPNITAACRERSAALRSA